MLTKRPKEEKRSQTFRYTKLIQFGVIIYLGISAVVNNAAFQEKAAESERLANFAYGWNIFTTFIVGAGTYITGEKIKGERRQQGDLISKTSQSVQEGMRKAHTVVSMTQEEYSRMQQVEPYITGTVDSTVTMARLRRRLKSRSLDQPALEPPKLS